MEDDFAYVSPNFNDIIHSVRKESIIRFYFVMDTAKNIEPQTDEEFYTRYQHINDLPMYTDATEDILETDTIISVAGKHIHLSDDKLYYITHDDCDNDIIELAHKIYQRACGNLVKKGILEPYFDAERNDFIFKRVEDASDD